MEGVPIREAFKGLDKEHFPLGEGSLFGRSTVLLIWILPNKKYVVICIYQTTGEQLHCNPPYGECLWCGYGWGLMVIFLISCIKVENK